MTNTIVHAQEEEAATVMASIGFAMSFALPNAETVEAMQAARRGELSSFKSIDALLADLIAGD